MGPPVPQAGVIGDLYIDVQTRQLFEKRAIDSVNPWGNYLFVVPEVYFERLKWFSSAPPANDLGVRGDYCLLWAGWVNYGMRASFYGPKQDTGWPENGEGGLLVIGDPGDEVLSVGIVDEGLTLAESNSTQLVVVGVNDEYIWPVPVSGAAVEPVRNIGVQSGPEQVDVTVNPLYSAVNQQVLT